MRNIFLFIILTHFSPLFAHSLPNSVISDCNLPAPTNLQAVETGPTYAIMAWDAVPGAAGYLVSWFNASGAQINADTTLDTEFEVQGLEPGETYNFRVAAVCVSGEPSAIYAPVIVVPIVTELVISSDNPLGYLAESCSQIVNPVAECIVDFNISTTFIGKLEITSDGKVYYFRIRYFNYEYKGSNSKIVVDLVKPKYYAENSIKRPGLFTENGEPSGLIFQYGSARKDNLEFIRFHISKTNDLIYKISLLEMTGNGLSTKFTLYSTNKMIGYASNNLTEANPENTKNIPLKIENKDLTIKKIRVYNVNGYLIKEIECDVNESFINNYLVDLPSGFYLLNKYYENSFFTEKIFKSNN